MQQEVALIKAYGNAPPLHKLKSQPDKHELVDNKDAWMTDSVSMAVWRRMKSTFRARACLSVYCEHEYTLQHVYECGDAWPVTDLMPRIGWDGKLVLTEKGIVFITTYQMIFLSVLLTFSLRLSHISTSRERGGQRLSAFASSAPAKQPTCSPPDSPLWTLTAE